MYINCSFANNYNTNMVNIFTIYKFYEIFFIHFW
nr:MAG TPA_asm: hypothetical protein [Caudoviricetes sp.]